MKGDTYGFTLIELMIVVAIIGMLAAAAIPAYNGYIARTQVSEAVSLAAGSKSILADYYSENARWPATLTSVVSVTSGRYVSTLVIDPASDDATGFLVLKAQMRNTNVSNHVAGKTVTLVTADKGQTWACNPPGDAGTLEALYVPGACQ